MTLTPSFVAYHGPSLFDGAPIVVVLTARSDNLKTGRSWQAWVLRADVPPMDALKTGDDFAICGDCRHRPNAEGRTCYVSLFTGPLGIYKAWKRGAYPLVTLDEAAARLAGGFVRVSAYGDPAAVRFEWWDRLLRQTDGWIGYTHQWRSTDQRFARLLMASVDTEAERTHAAGIGWRTFRARSAGTPLDRAEFQCPASDEAGHRTTCEKCRLCRGQSSPAKSVSIELHGRHFKPLAGAEMVSRRSEMSEIRAELERGEIHRSDMTFRGYLKTNLALRMFYRRKKDPRSVVTDFHLKTGKAAFELVLDKNQSRL